MPIKSKKMKGSKMRRREVTKNNMSKSTLPGRKGVIVEMAEEYSGSEGGHMSSMTRGQDGYDKNATWQDFQDENKQLKD